MRIKGFELISELPRGGSSRCFRVKNDRGRVYILKLFCPAALERVCEMNERGIIKLRGSTLDEARFSRMYQLFRREALVSQELLSERGGTTNSDYFYSGEFFEICEKTADTAGAFILYDTSAGDTLDELLAERELWRDEKNGVTLATAWTLRIAEAVQKLHEHKAENGEPSPYLHLDIKPTNIYCTEMKMQGDDALRVFKMIDLGSAMPLGNSARDEELRRDLMRSLTATQSFAAPEVLDIFATGATETAARVLSEKSDIYSIAAVLFYMLAGYQYDYDDVKIDSPAVNALPVSARAKLERLLRCCLETRERCMLSFLAGELRALIDIIERRGLSHELLFEGARSFAQSLPEKPDPRLLTQYRKDKKAFDCFAEVPEKVNRSFLLGSGMQGKTFAILDYCVKNTDKYSENAAVPLYIPLRALMGKAGETPISDYIAARYGGEKTGEHAMLLRALIKRHKFHILADGLNEIEQDEVFSAVCSELRELCELGAWLTVSSQTDLRQSAFSGLGLELFEAVPLKGGRVLAYISSFGLEIEDLGLLQTLSMPMLLKMYALSESAVVNDDLLSNPKLRFARGAKTPAKIIINYREYILSKFLCKNFDEACVILRMFLPFLAYNLCADERMITINNTIISCELNAFFCELQERFDYLEYRKYGAPDFVPADRKSLMQKYNSDKKLVYGVNMMINGAYDLDAARLNEVSDGYLNDLAEEIISDLSGTLQLPKPSEALDALMLMDARNARPVEILKRCGLLTWDGDGTVSFAHEELKSVFCAEYLAGKARADSQVIKSAFGSYKLSRKTVKYLAELCDCGAAIEKMRGCFDLLDYELLRLFDPDSELVVTAPLYSDAGFFSIAFVKTIEWLLKEFGFAPRVHDAIHSFGADRFQRIIQNVFFDIPGSETKLSAEDKKLIARAEKIVDEVIDSDEVLSALWLVTSALRRATAFSRILSVPGDMTSLISPQGFIELHYAGEGRAAVAVANLVECMNAKFGLSGVNLSNLDLTQTALYAMNLKGANLSNSKIREQMLSGFDPGRAPLLAGESAHMLYSDSGRYIYYMHSRRVSCFDLFLREKLFEIETKAAVDHFWLIEKEGCLAVISQTKIVKYDMFVGDAFSYLELPCGEGEPFAPPFEPRYIAYGENNILVQARDGDGNRVIELTKNDDSYDYSEWKGRARITNPMSQRFAGGKPQYKSAKEGKAKALFGVYFSDETLFYAGLGSDFCLAHAINRSRTRYAEMKEDGLYEYDYKTRSVLAFIPAKSDICVEGADFRGVFPKLSANTTCALIHFGATLA